LFFPFAKYYNRFCYCSTWGKEDHTRSFASFVSFLLFSLVKAGEGFVGGGAKRERERERASERAFILFVFEDARAAASEWHILGDPRCCDQAAPPPPPPCNCSNTSGTSSAAYATNVQICCFPLPAAEQEQQQQTRT
jgi:hypothetical protein